MFGIVKGLEIRSPKVWLLTRGIQIQSKKEGENFYVYLFEEI